MGNTQSAPAPRRPPNKLSKPRTNNSSTANLPSTKTPLVTGRHDSQSNHGFASVSRYSIVSVDGVVGNASEKLREESQRKRMSLFRSNSSQPKILQELEIDTGVERGFVDPSPVDRPVHSWSRSERSYSETFEFPTDQPYYNPPAERYDPYLLQMAAANGTQQTTNSNCTNVTTARPTPSSPSTIITCCRSTITATTIS
jgi:hypothetical protein